MQLLLKWQNMSKPFKNITFSDVGCTLCNKSHKSLDCPSLRSIIDMEVSSSASPNDSSSSSDSHSRSPNRDFGSHRRSYMHGSRSTSRSPRCFDRGYSPEKDYIRGRDYHYHSPDGNNNYWDRQYNPGYYGRRYNNSNGFSPDRIYSQFKAATRVTIRERAQIAITMRVMDGTRGLNVVEKNSTEINSKIIRTTNLNRIMAVKSQLLVEMIAIRVIRTITLLLPSLRCQALWHVMVLRLMLEEIMVFQTPTQ